MAKRNFIKTVKNTINNWWIPLLVGVIFIVVGIATFTYPDDAYSDLSMLFSISFIIVGLAEIIFAFSNREELEGWGWLLTLGILTLLVGVLLVQNPDVSENIMPYYVAFLLLFRSLMGISQAMDMKSYGILDWGNVMLVSVLAAILSLVLLWNPNFAGMSIVFWTAITFIILGIASIYVAFKLRSIKRIPIRLKKELRDDYNAIQDKIYDAVNQIQSDVKQAANNIKSDLNSDSNS